MPRGRPREIPGPTAVNIMFLVRSMGVGGAERQLCVLSRRLLRRGHTVKVLLYYGGEPLESELHEMGATVIDLHKGGRWRNLGFLIRLVRRVREERPDVVYALLPLSNLLALLLRYVGGGCAIACGVRAADVRLPRLDWLTRVAAQLERRLVHRADVVIVNSQNGARFLYGDHRPGNVLVIDNGIETQDYSYDPSGRARLRDAWGLGADTPLVGCVARLDPIKDHATLLRAFAQLRQMRADAQLVCVGTPAEPLQAQLRDLARRLGIDAAVRWIERVPQVRELYSALDAVCLSSTSEGFPNVLAEAMACGVPCVATDVGDTRRILSTADFVVPPRNPEALAGALAAALAQARQFSDLRADKIRREFSAQALVERTEVALSSALQRRDARVLKGVA